jgi:hypothetical protein
MQKNDNILQRINWPIVMFVTMFVTVFASMYSLIFVFVGVLGCAFCIYQIYVDGTDEDASGVSNEEPIGFADAEVSNEEPIRFADEDEDEEENE